MSDDQIQEMNLLSDIQSLPELTVNIMSFDVTEDNCILHGSASVPGFPPFYITFDGYKSYINGAYIPLPPQQFLTIIDMMMKFYFAGRVKSDNISFNMHSGKSYLNNKTRNIEDELEGEENEEHGDNTERGSETISG